MNGDITRAAVGAIGLRAFVGPCTRSGFMITLEGRADGFKAAAIPRCHTHCRIGA